MGILLSIAMCLLIIMAPSAMARRYHYLSNSAAVAPAAGESAISWNNRGVDFYGSGKYAAAIAAYDRAIKLNPRYTDAYSNRGVAYDAMNQPERAVMDYSKAVQLNPSATACYVNRGLAYTDLARFNDAIADWNVVLKRNPRNSDAYYRRAFCYQSLGSLDKALADYEKACKLNPRLAKAIKNRDTIRKALAIAPSSTNSAESGFTPLPMEKQIQSNASADAESKIAQPVRSENAAEALMSTPSAAAGQSADANGERTAGGNGERSPRGSEAQSTGRTGAQSSGGNVALSSGGNQARRVGASEAQTAGGSQAQRGGANEAQTPGGNPPGSGLAGMTVSSSASGKSNMDAAGYCVSVIRHVEGNFLSLVRQYDAAAASFSGAITMNPKDHFAYYRRGNAYLASGKKQLALADFDAAVQLNPRFKQAKAMRDKVASEVAHR